MREDLDMNQPPYAEFLRRKTRTTPNSGHACAPTDVNPILHPWQTRIVAWAVRKGRAAIWADTGLGKTFMQLEWCRLSGDRALIVAPLAVCQQTIREAAKLGIIVRYLREDDGLPGIIITNYEMCTAFDAATLDAVCLDESSILKQHDGKTRNAIISHFRAVRNRLSCTATPAPNDPEELTSQAEYLGIMPRNEMLAAYFVNDEKSWRLKGHAREPMFTWMASWAVAIRRPSDLGYEDGAYSLPPLSIQQSTVDTVVPAGDGELFAASIGGIGGRSTVRKHTLTDRVARAVELVKEEPDEPWLLWCGLNDEADLLAQSLPGAVNVAGNWSPEAKADAFLGFADGSIRYLVTKPSIAAFGLNFQHCARMAFVGIGDSYEQYYQAIRRCWRYGQTREVQVHIVVSQIEGNIAANVSRKERQATLLNAGLVAAMTSHHQIKEIGS